MSALGSFKSISCPKGTACPHVNCLFSHPGEGDNSRPHVIPEVAAPIITPDLPAQDHDGGPRKRQKTLDRSSSSAMASDNLMLRTMPQPAYKTSDGSMSTITSDGSNPGHVRDSLLEPEYDPSSPALARVPPSKDASQYRPANYVTSVSTHSTSLSPSAAKSPSYVGNALRGQSLALVPDTKVSLKSRISPPPLKRKLSSPNSPASKPKKQATQTPSSTKIQTHFSTPSSTPLSTPSLVIEKPKPKPKPKPRKPETLNPRLITPSPASHELRLKLLKLLHAEFARLNKDLKTKAKDEEKELVLSDQELIWRALDEEEQATKKGPIYTNVIKNRIMSYKRMTQITWIEEQRKLAVAQCSSKDAAPPNGKPVETGLTPAQEIDVAQRLLTPLKDLALHGYVPQVPDKDEVEKVRKGVEAAQGWEKCDRCNQRFQVFPGRHEETGQLASGGKCTFHPGKPYYPEQGSTRNDASRPVKRYRCCHEAIGDSVGCFTGDSHVFRAPDPKRLSTVLSFTETPENPGAEKGPAFCFDCEMGYTVYGSELIRLTVVSWPSGKVALDLLVQPKGEILDLNSRFSGVFPEDIANAERWNQPVLPPVDLTEPVDGIKKGFKIIKSPEAARDLFYSMISPSTILIGHGLENDLNVCRMVHPTVIDTILLFPHRNGLPMRNGLKALAQRHLGMQIQVDNGGQGHDSAEDARAAGELVRFKIKQEWTKMQDGGWKIVDGKLVEPRPKTKA
ncbi:RNA exonuclease 3 [Zalerion maritima]|uniref:RNA exonuclease 3 n=1 Tax=Zalerion maritima TaxID=339359 RepID=A0AAD5RU78_9PEZI|nr:RNA exonuclease 3 [Zalerion maritima]